MAIIKGTNGDNLLRGTVLNDLITGLNGADSFYWQRNQGNDTFIGGDGGERYDSNPYTPGNPGGDHLFLEGAVRAKITFTSTEDGTVLIGRNKLVFSGIERLYGTAGNDIIRAANAVQEPAHSTTVPHGLTLYTGAGNDYIEATRYEDIIHPGDGNDTVLFGDGNDVLHSSTGSDLIYGGAGNENLRWGTGNNTHNPGNDTIYGGTGDDLINIWIKDGDTSPETEAVGIPGITVTITSINSAHSFAGHASTNIGGPATLRFYEMELGWTHGGNDNVSAAGASIAANQAGFNFNTRWGHDRLTGSRGNDTLGTDAGRDTVTGGAGNDDLWIGFGPGGDGERDTIIFRRGDGDDTIHGFETGLDVLNLGSHRYSSARETADGTLLSFASGDSILLAGVFDFV